MKKEILTVPNEILRKNAEPVNAITPEVIKIVKDLFDTLDSTENPGVGMAAPQIGVSKRIIVFGYKGDVDEGGNVRDQVPRMALINPEIQKCSQEKIEMDEGCFSVPLTFGPVVRPKKIKLTALDAKGNKIKLNVSGYTARVIQHEIDHLNGVIFTDLVTEKSRITKYRKMTDGEYELEI